MVFEMEWLGVAEGVTGVRTPMLAGAIERLAHSPFDLPKFVRDVPVPMMMWEMIPVRRQTPG